MTDVNKVDEFVNAYQFIPVDERIAESVGENNLVRRLRDGLPSAQDFHARENLGRMRHDVWPDDTFSGRVLCRLEAETPLVIGAQQHPGRAKDGASRVDPFRLDGEVAIPASSLRGMISTLAEVASGSALRILDDKKILSRRRRPEEALSALGIIRERDAEGRLTLEPLAAPTWPKHEPLSCGWEKAFKNWRFKIYLDGYKTTTNCKRKTVRKSSNTPLDHTKKILTERQNGAADRAGTDEWFYLSGLGLGDGPPPETNTQPSDAGFSLKQKWFLGKSHALALEAPEKAKLTDSPVEGSVRGFARVLGVRPFHGEGSNPGMPKTKYHEIFIPYPEAWEQSPEEKLSVPPEVEEAFHLLADERWSDVTRDGKKKVRDENELLPFHEMHRARGGKKGKLRLKPGDIVFFDVDGEGMITQVSYSAIWRDYVRKESTAAKPAGVHDFFKKAETRAGRELLPFHPGRKEITPAEALFGFVTEGRDGADGELDANQAWAYKGRVRVSFGRHGEREAALGDGLLEEEEITLRALNSPKPPAPDMYFHDKGGKPIRKETLSFANDGHLPQGVKAYVHEPGGWEKRKPRRWETLANKNDDRHANLKNAVRPIKAGTAFWFHVDFDNLSEAELSLLLFCLRPAGDFYHKLGMGKPLGLGTVRIDPAGLFLIDRQQRYRPAAGDGFFDAERYFEADVFDEAAIGGAPGEFYAPEIRAAADPTPTNDRAGAYAGALKQALPKTHAAILLLGRRPKAGVTVGYPMAAGQNGEDEGYQWFVHNANPPAKRQALRPIAPGDQELPSLKVNKYTPNPRNRPKV